MNADQREMARNQAQAVTDLRGTPNRPFPPRDIQVQSGPRKLLATWKLPAAGSDEIVGWRVYKDDETTLYASIGDRGTRRCEVAVTAGSSPSTVNIFVSSVNAAGVESTKVQAQGSATAEAGAPSEPSVPPGYTSEASAGRDTSGGGIVPHGGIQS